MRSLLNGIEVINNSFEYLSIVKLIFLKYRLDFHVQCFKSN